MSVIAADELDDLGAPREGTGETNGRHGGFGSRVDQPDDVERRHHLADALGDVDLGLRRCTKAGAARRRLLDGLDDARVRVAEEQRAPGADVVDVAVAVDVADARAGAILHEHRVAADGAKGTHRRVHATRHDAHGALHELVTAWSSMRMDGVSFCHDSTGI